MGGIVWLASFPKSGNTWVRYFLHALIQGGQVSLNRMNALTVGDADVRWYAPDLTRPLGEYGYEDFAALRLAAIRRIAAQTDGLVFVKTHNALVAHAGVPMIDNAVTAGAIYIVRNPLDVAVSLAGFLGKTVDEAVDEITRDGATMPASDRFACQYFGSWGEHVESWTRRPIRQLHVMRYEDMLAAPQETFGRLARFLRLSPGADELARAIEAASFERLRAQEQSEGFVEKPESAERFFREGRAGQWREHLTAGQVARIAAAFAPQMARFGYTPAPA